MGRIVVHLHGAPREKAMRNLVDMYMQRIQPRGIRLEIHPDKMNPTAYGERLLQLKGSLMLLDEGGESMDSVGFSRQIEAWTLATSDMHLAVGPAEGWPDMMGLNNLPRLSLSNMTFPHELASVMLVEQVYRATELLRGSGYHKA